MTGPNRPAAIRRLRKIEGQVRGLARMLQEDRYCIDVLQQIQAVKAALVRVESLILKDHAASCVEGAIASGDPEDQRRKFSELVDLLDQVRR
ncbi:MAG: metal-sensing transcriptional repressor [Alphaproteobacteria bacterium]|nr:metal-sensing transcriptional repressor [Alphaproteobacteria bacterium]